MASGRPCWPGARPHQLRPSSGRTRLTAMAIHLLDFTTAGIHTHPAAVRERRCQWPPR